MYRLKCIANTNYLEKGLSLFYEILHSQIGEVSTLGGPAIYRSHFLKEFSEECSSVGSSIDTEMDEYKSRKGYKVGYANTFAFQKEDLEISSFSNKYFWYGKGDYDFYNQHKSNWSIRRKLKSITHVFNRYIIDYPLKAIKMGKVLYVPYFWLSAVVRYCGWIYTIIKGK